MNILKLSQKLKIIPEDIKEISSGTIIEINEDTFVVAQDFKSCFGSKKVEIIVYTEHNLVKFDTTIVKTDKNLIYFKYPLKYELIQRREYSRADINIPVKYRLINRLNETYDSYTRNISGGGFQIISKSKLKQGAVLEAEIFINNKRNINAVAKILRIERGEEENFFLSSVFKKIANIDRIAIIQLCFKRQLELKYKGVGT